MKLASRAGDLCVSEFGRENNKAMTIGKNLQTIVCGAVVTGWVGGMVSDLKRYLTKVGI